MGRLVPILALSLGLAAYGAAQEPVEPEDPEAAEELGAEEEDLDPDLPPISYEGALEIGSQSVPLPIAYVGGQPFFLLEPIVTALESELWVGPKKESHRFEIRNTTYSLGSTSSVMVIDEEIVRISQSPVLSQRGLVVPVDLLEKSYGDQLGIAFVWRERERALELRRRQPRTVQVAVDAVALQGTSTVVLEFEERIDYSVRQRGAALLIEASGDLLRRVGPRPRFDRDPLIDDLRVFKDGIRLELDSRAEAAEPYELRGGRFSGGFRLVFDVSRRARGARRSPFEPILPTSTVRTIVIDPGHGGTETGAIGAGGTLEKDLTLVLARQLSRKLRERLPVKVVLTRDEDAQLELETRTALANENRADLFLSIHLNSSHTPAANGAETFFLDLEAADGEATDADLDFLRWDLAHSRHLESSRALATLIQMELNETLGQHDRGVFQAPFAVLQGATMPAVLLELGFLSNPGEEEKLLDPGYRSELLDAVVRAILRYYASDEDEIVFGTPRR